LARGNGSPSGEEERAADENHTQQAQPDLSFRGVCHATLRANIIT
jgi:hypothetical protein